MLAPTYISLDRARHVRDPNHHTGQYRDLLVVRRAILQTIVQRNREGIPDARRERKDRARGKTDSSNDNFHTLSDDDDTASESEDSCEDEQAVE